jgi:hypothetical protein
VPTGCITDANSSNPMLRLFSRRAQRDGLPMAGHLDLRGHFDSDEDLGISGGYRTFSFLNRRETAYSTSMRLEGRTAPESNRYGKRLGLMCPRSNPNSIQIVTEIMSPLACNTSSLESHPNLRSTSAKSLGLISSLLFPSTFTTRLESACL